jgi:uncharacterized protein YjbI with pentapeptide repeats
MRKLPPLLVFFLLETAAYAVGPAKPCPGLTPAKGAAEWVWVDANCNRRTGADLNRILDNHKLWLKKYAASLGDQATLLTNGALADPLRAELSSVRLLHAKLAGADLVLADLSHADLTDADLNSADLTGASLIDSDLTSADLEAANLSGAVFINGYLGGANLNGADLTGANLSESDLTGANLTDADLNCAGPADGKHPCAILKDADLSTADLGSAQLIGADLANATLPGADLHKADLTGANLRDADLTKASLVQADLSSAIMQRTEFTDADLTLAEFWYSDFEPKGLLLLGTIAPGEGLETVRWSIHDKFNNELSYRLRVEQALQTNGPMPPLPSVQNRWLVWLSCYRERLDSGKDIPLQDGAFLVSDVLLGLQSHGPRGCASLTGISTGESYEESADQESPQEKSEANDASTLAEYQLMDIRTAEQTAGHAEIALEANLAYQRHMQSPMKMIVFDWTCSYGAAPDRPIILAGLLALMALPFYWFGSRRQWLGVQLLRVDEQGKEEEIPKGGLLNRPKWVTPLGVEPAPKSTVWLRLLTRLHLKGVWDRLRLFLAARSPRVVWEISFLKAVILFSLISVIDLGFEGFDFGRWVRMLFFTEYDLKARGWLRFVSGLQSLIGLGLLALALLSFFGHQFD